MRVVSPSRCDAYTPIRWRDRRCDAPAVHGVWDGPTLIGEYCDRCFQAILQKLGDGWQVYPASTLEPANQN